MITKFNVGGETTGALGSFLLEDANVARKKALRDDALAAARKAEQVVMVLGIRSGGYGILDVAFVRDSDKVRAVSAV